MAQKLQASLLSSVQVWAKTTEICVAVPARSLHCRCIVWGFPDTVLLASDVNSLYKSAAVARAASHAAHPATSFEGNGQFLQLQVKCLCGISEKRS